MNIDYQTLINGIFVCGLPAVNDVIKNENVKAIVDLRAEAKEDTIPGNVIYRNVPLIDGEPNQTKLLKEAVTEVIQFYKGDKQVVLH
ncbi:hypothetical protein CR194_07160 [Salipaludibacillus keqinensis]|uniref:Rhodanese domain-containing protein n=1 Tax=Salipaludibacillus keqinensis TaxID=2045207 RepID=A0A323TJI1_9BACI|nr:hypothetical protein [Salipaludibacillus keqinensis]PYZ95282.1 hypothetical protein CR194_07160 [Salipaludibacillus keqinensis]